MQPRLRNRHLSVSFCRTNNSPAVIFEASQISHFADMIYRMILSCNRVQIPAGRHSLTVNILDLVYCGLPDSRQTLKVGAPSCLCRS